MDVTLRWRGLCGAVCSQASITVQNTSEDGAKYLNQGAPYGTKEWREQYPVATPLSRATTA